MNLPSKKYTVTGSLLALLLCLSAPHTLGCGPEMYADDTRFALFYPALDGLSGLEPFYYSARLLNSPQPDRQGKDRQRNCAEWLAFCNDRTVTLQDIYRIQYTTSADGFLYACNTGDWSAMQDNTFTQWLREKEHATALAYMKLAKASEFVNDINGADDPWHRSDTKNPGGAIQGDSLLITASKACYASQPGFLRERYAFQAMRIWYYLPAAHRGDSILHLQRAFLEGHATVIAGWANIYCGLACDDTVLSQYYLLRAFDESDEKKVCAFRFLKDKDFTAFLHSRYATPHLRSVALTIKILANPGRALADIRKMASACPHSKYLPALLTREVNKLEDWIWTPDILGFEPFLPKNRYNAVSHYITEDRPCDTTYAYYALKNYRKDRLYLQEVKEFIQSLAARHTPEQPFFCLTAAHLCNLSGEYGRALNYAGKIRHAATATYRAQQLVEQMIADAHRLHLRTSYAKSRMAAELAQTEQLTAGLRYPTTDTDSYYTDRPQPAQNPLSELYVLLSRQYRKAGDIVTASLLYNKSLIMVNEYDGGPGPKTNGDQYSSIAYLDRYATPADVDKLRALLHKKNKTSFEQLIQPVAGASDDFYKDLKGTLLFRERKYREAEQVFSEMPDSFWVQHDQFAGCLHHLYIGSPGLLIPGSGGRNAYPLPGKKQIVHDINLLYDSLKTAHSNEAGARLCYELGNAMLQTSYHGRAWIMFSYGWSDREIAYSEREDEQWAWFDFYPNRDRYFSRYYQCADALAMYRKAATYASKTTDSELAAGITLMQAYCDALAFKAGNRNHPRRAGIYCWHEPPNYYSPYLNLLMRRYQNTALFATVSTACPDVAGYMAHAE